MLCVCSVVSSSVLLIDLFDFILVFFVIPVNIPHSHYYSTNKHKVCAGIAGCHRSHRPAGPNSHRMRRWVLVTVKCVGLGVDAVMHIA